MKKQEKTRHTTTRRKNPKVLNVRLPAGYEPVRLLGKGGMSNVYLAEQPALERLVAIKVLDKDLLADDIIRQRFAREAKVIANLNQENIVRIHDYIERYRNIYIIMEYVEGTTLEHLKMMHKAMHPDIVAGIIRQVLSGMEAAHAQGVVHRDLKPRNIMIRPDGRIKILDFGIARQGAESELTAVGTIIGTPTYMSPEQAAGDPANARSDIFSLGIIIYEMLVGDKPGGPTMWSRVLNDKTMYSPLSPRMVTGNIPRTFDRLIRRATAFNADKRFENAHQMRLYLDRAMPGAATWDMIARYLDNPRRVTSALNLKNTLKKTMFFVLFLLTLAVSVLSIRYYGWQKMIDIIRNMLPGH